MALHLLNPASLIHRNLHRLSLRSLLRPNPIVAVALRRTLGFRHRRFCCCPGTMGASAVVVKDRIDLSDKEEKIFRRLLDVVQHFGLKTELRVAGGWVRDKLLGKDCHDIDIALDNLSGREFAEKVNEYLVHSGEEQRSIGVIHSNPDQSKHLETATMRIYDLWIDFVNLRSETYTENSRIPTMMFGTAEEDAYRRDLTINSLFYNINTSSVEDFTGRGIEDLKAGIIVTPLPPKETFLDDPLRVLRAIRFGSRFSFVLDEELQKAASDEEVRAGIANKISRERIGHEVDLMISDKQPVKAIKCICDLTLFNAVFPFPDDPQPKLFEGHDRLCLSFMDAAWNLYQSVDCSIFNNDQRRLYLYATLFLPVRNMVYIETKSKKIPVTSHIFRNSLKLKVNDADMVASLHAASERFVSLIPYLLSTDNCEFIHKENDELGEFPPSSKKRVLAGLLLREIKEFWRVSLLLSTILYHKADSAEICDEDSTLERKRIFEQVETVITQLGLLNVWKVKPLLDGKEIMGVLQIKTGGRVVGEWQKKVLHWQLANPEASSEQCLDWLKESYSKRAKMDCPQV